MAETRTNLTNIDIYGLIRRIDRTLLEVGQCQSADQANGLMDADKARILDYMSDDKAYLAYCAAAPTPDCPESHGQWSIPLPPEPDFGRPVETISNDDIVQILHLLKVQRMEIANSQSARLVQGVKDFDRVRFDAGYDRVVKFVNDYISNTQPSDRPESAPFGAPVPAGKIGT